MQTIQDRYWTRQGMKMILWVLLLLILVVGWFVPAWGFILLGCMAAAVGVAFFRGRAWCDVCPRGAFFDVLMHRMSQGRPIPRFLRSPAFRLLMLAVLMTVMVVRLTPVWGDLPKMGMVFWMILAVTTVVGVILAIPFNARTWCALCPMGSMAYWIGRGKQPLAVDREQCNACGRCARVCPMELYPGAHREEGVMTHGDCLKCSSCVVACPRQALSFEKVPHSDEPDCVAVNQSEAS